jgi:hypothetical protein
LGNQIRKKEVGTTCSKCGREEGRIEVSSGGPDGKDHSEYLGIDGRIILKLVVNKWTWCMYWIYLAQDGDRWRALVNAIINLVVP